MRHIALLLLFLSVFTHAFEFDDMTNDIFEQIHESEEIDDVSMESSENLESVFDNVDVSLNKGNAVLFDHNKLQGLITKEDKENEDIESEDEEEKLHIEHKNAYKSYVLVNINKSNIIVFFSSHSDIVKTPT